MKRETKITIWISIIAVAISAITIVFDLIQNKQISELQFELNSISYKPIIKVDNILLTSFSEQANTLLFPDELKNPTRLIKVGSKIETDVTFYIQNIGNTNAQIIAAFCIDTISGDDKLREIIYRKELSHQIDSSNNEFYSFLHLQPNEKDKLKFHIPIDFINNETFAIHLLILYRNELNMLYDSYYWAKFKKQNLMIDFKVDSTNKIIWSKLTNNKNEYVKFIDQNIAYKVYTKKEIKNFNLLLNKIKNKN